MHTVAELPLVGGHPALDLVNSIERGTPRPDRANHDYLDGAASVIAWGARAGLLAEPDETDAVRSAWQSDPAAAERAVHRLTGLREAIHAALRAALGTTGWGDDRAAGALARIHAEWKAAMARSTITAPPPGQVAVRIGLGAEPAELLPDRAAQSALDLLCGDGDELGRVRECPVELGGCGWLFLDRSRNGSRRWCRMADCGNKVKATRLTERRRAARSPSGRAGHDPRGARTAPPQGDNVRRGAIRPGRGPGPGGRRAAPRPVPEPGSHP
jgi:predicted RNA-binding Zn ribbon-like protein